jgi:hypothetical protein
MKDDFDIVLQFANLTTFLIPGVQTPLHALRRVAHMAVGPRGQPDLPAHHRLNCLITRNFPIAVNESLAWIRYPFTVYGAACYRLPLSD